MDDICHIINMPHHVLNDCCPKRFVRNDFRDTNNFFIFMIGILIINLIIYLKISTSDVNASFWA